VTDVPVVAILAGGLATRLGSKAYAKPKSMMDILGKPFIEYQLRQLSKQGATDVVICLGHLGSQIEDFVGDGRRFDLAVRYSVDGEVKLGTGGALAKALPLLGSEFLVTYGDSFLQLDFEGLILRHTKYTMSATMAIIGNNDKWDKSNVSLIDPRTIEYSSHYSGRKEFIDYGASIVNADAFKTHLKSGAWDLSEYFESISRDGKLGFYEEKKRFYEIGSLLGLNEFREYVAKGKTIELLTDTPK
jgi:MurNAc alpha-1-phosphate uridylyltransferase